MATNADLQREIEALKRSVGVRDAARRSVLGWLSRLRELGFGAFVGVPAVGAWLAWAWGTTLADAAVAAGVKSLGVVVLYSIIVRTVIVAPRDDDDPAVHAARLHVRAAVFLGLAVIVGLG